MSKYTAGPWAVFNSTDVFTTSRQGRTNDGYQIADCAVDWHSVEDPTISHQEIQANARLIAAAPDLLSLLKEARSTLEMWKDVAPAVSLCADIDKAIAKATGEAQ